VWGSSPPLFTLMICQAPWYQTLYWSSVQYLIYCTTFIFTKNLLPEKSIELFCHSLYSMQASYIFLILCFYLLFFPSQFLVLQNKVSQIDWCFSIFFPLVLSGGLQMKYTDDTENAFSKQRMYKNVKSGAIFILIPNLSPCFQIVCLFVFSTGGSWWVSRGICSV